MAGGLPVVTPSAPFTLSDPSAPTTINPTAPGTTTSPTAAITTTNPTVAITTTYPTASTTPTSQVNDEKKSPRDSESSDNSSNRSTSQRFLQKIRSLHDIFSLSSIRVTTPARIFNPTAVRMGVKWRTDADPTGVGLADGSDLALLWRSRDSRKGRSSIAVSRSASNAASDIAIAPALLPHRRLPAYRQILQTLRSMCTTFPYWDMAFWIGFGYTIGSTFWVINGCFAWLPLAFPETEFPGEVKYGGGITALLGVVCFEVAGVIAYLEAINEGTFGGPVMKRFLEGRPDEQKRFVDAKLRAWFRRGSSTTTLRGTEDLESTADTAVGSDLQSEGKSDEEEVSPTWMSGGHLCLRHRRSGEGSTIQRGELVEYTPFRWLPTWENLWSYHIYDIGFLACVIQLFGATVFMCTGIVAQPGILDSLEHWQVNACYWIPQMFASLCFIIASVLFTVENQETWWRPAPNVLGWWIGAWSVVGSIGFELCGSLGPVYDNPAIVYQCYLASLWGSAAFWISSWLQWYEAMSKDPIEAIDTPPEMKSWQTRPL